MKFFDTLNLQKVISRKKVGNTANPLFAQDSHQKTQL